MTCIVENCTEPATTAVEVPPLTGKSSEDYGPWSVVACSFHAQALQAGEAFTETDEGKFRIGTQGVPPRLLGFILNETGLAMPELTLRLGHDGIVDQEVTMQISTELHKHLFINDQSELAKESDRNTSDS